MGLDKEGDRPILVVDDEPIIVELVALNLRDAGYPVITCESGEEAVKIIENIGALGGKADLITDLMMPGINGVEVGHSFRRVFPENAVAILMTGYEGNNLSASHFDKIINKPFDCMQMVEIIRGLRERSLVLAS